MPVSSPGPSNVQRLCERLGYAHGAGRLLRRETATGAHVPHVVRQAFERIGIEAAFGVDDPRAPERFQPFVYLAACHSDRDAREIHRRVWSQGVAPILILMTPEGVAVTKGLQPPPERYSPVDPDPDADLLPENLASFAAERLCASSFWRDFRVSERGASVDERLIGAIRQINAHVRRRFPEVSRRSGLVNRIVARTIYLGMLMDRGFVTREWLVAQLAARGMPGSCFPEAMGLAPARLPARLEWAGREFWCAMDIVDDALNGSVFEVGAEERRVVSDTLLQTVHGVIRRGERLDPEGHVQGSFLDFAFDVIRTETLSAIYQEFLHGDPDSGGVADGAFYTPPFVADHLVDLVFATRAPRVGTSVLDPACGSGIFLVATYRRLLETARPEAGWSIRHARLARSILTESIFGIEKDEQAVNVARLGLYVTLLDHLRPASIEELADAVPGVKLLPDLKRNVVRADAFKPAAFGERRFTHVLTNPPWDQSRGRRRRAKRPPAEPVRKPSEALVGFDAELARLKLPVGADRLSDRFVWLAKLRFLEPGGVLGAVLPTKSLVGIRSERFARAVASELAVGQLIDLSQLRRTLFVGAEAPATLVVATNEEAPSSKQVRVRRVTKAAVPLGSRDTRVWTLLGADGDEDTCRVADLLRNGWHEPLVLSAEDRRIAEALRALYPSGSGDLRAFLVRSGLRAARGGDRSETGLRDVPAEPRPGAELDEEQSRYANVWQIDQAALQALIKPYRDLFAGRMLLVARSLEEVRYLDTPHAFRSTYKGIYAPDALMREGDDFVAGMKGLGRCLRSNTIRYFAWLFGSTYAILGDRVELSDLERFPFPFDTLKDRRLVDVGRYDVDVEAVLADALKLGPDVRALVREHGEFVAGFRNAQVPADAFLPPDDDEIRAYLGKFGSEITRAFPADEAIEVTAERERPFLAVQLRRGGAALPMLRPYGYVGVSAIAVDQETGCGTVLKSLEKHAFTLRQAAADAGAVLRRIAR